MLPRVILHLQIQNELLILLTFLSKIEIINEY